MIESIGYLFFVFLIYKGFNFIYRKAKDFIKNKILKKE